MKKIITFFASFILVASSFAQYNSGGQRDKRNDVVYNDSRDNKHNDRRDNHDYNFSARERDMQINHINREYDNRIFDVQHKVFMSHGKKRSIIRSLEEQRRDEIKMVYIKFNHGNNHYDRYDKKRW
ncbi:MAG: hypothetical protein ABJB11_00130 [Ferruginibacter sp.]